MKILFVCEYNACRSQMAEGLARALLPKDWGIHSAGLYPGELHAVTVEAMKDIDIDITVQRSKRLAEAKEHMPFDLVIVLAEPAWEPSREISTHARLLWHFTDPAAGPGHRDAIMSRIRTVRDGLKEKIAALKRKKIGNTGGEDIE